MSPAWGGDIPQLQVSKLQYAFLTHIHSDHSAGLADLILTPWVMGRDTELKLFGPKGLKAMSKGIISAYELDILYRLNGTQPANPTGYKTIVKEIDEGVIFKDDHVEVTAFYNDHGGLRNSFGYLFKTKDKKILFSGDTSLSNNLIKHGNDLDILVHEVYSSEGFKTKTDDWKIYHKGHHTSPQELAKIAALLEPKTLVLSHVLIWGATSNEIISDITKSYNGKVIFPDDVTLIN